MGKKWLDIVYNEKSSVRLKEHYKNWASKYDNDLILEYLDPNFEMKDIVPYMSEDWNKMGFICIQIIYSMIVSFYRANHYNLF